MSGFENPSRRAIHYSAMATVSRKISSQTLLSINNSAVVRLSTGSVDSYIVTGIFLHFLSNCLFLPPASSQKQRCRRIAGLPTQYFKYLLPPMMDATAAAGAAISRMGLRNETHVSLKSFTAIFWSERMLALVTEPNSSSGNYIPLTQIPPYSFSRLHESSC